MWLFTRYGFFSVTVSKQDPSKMQIRARSKADLERLAEFAKDKMGADLGEIIETPHADYHYRLIVGPSTWGQLAVKLADDVDYSNFKNEIRDPYRHALYEEVWFTMLKLQRRG
jgi:hypothetical protein